MLEVLFRDVWAEFFKALPDMSIAGSMRSSGNTSYQTLQEILDFQAALTLSSSALEVVASVKIVHESTPDSHRKSSKPRP